MTSLSRFRAAFAQGLALSALSACAGTATDAPSADGSGGTNDETGGASSDTGGASGASTGGASGGTASFALLPGADERECQGEIYDDPEAFGLHGQCCPLYSCGEAKDDGTCPASDDFADLQSLPGYPQGSGTCSCASTEGPFSPNPENTAVQGEGACCYVLYSIGCDGRPLRDEDALVVAPVVRRGDWV